jgi:hypothetical protein
LSQDDEEGEAAAKEGTDVCGGWGVQSGACAGESSKGAAMVHSSTVNSSSSVGSAFMQQTW